MKKLILIVIAIVFASVVAEAQIRHVKGIKGGEGQYLITKHGSGFMFGYSQYLSNKLYFKVALGREIGTAGSTGYTSYILQPDVNYTFLNWNEIVFINATGGLSTFMDRLDSESLEQSSFIQLGLHFGSEIEIYLTDNFAIVSVFKQAYDIQDNFGRTRYFLSGGLKYAF